MQYRVNFGQGQIHYAGSQSDCQRFIADHCDGFAFLEFLDLETGDWFGSTDPDPTRQKRRI